MDFKLRPWKIEDVDSLVKYANNFNIAKNLQDRFPHPYTIQDAHDFINMNIAKGEPTEIFAIEVNGEAVGGIGLHPQGDIHAKNAEMGYWLAERYWGNGIVPRAIRQMVKYGFEAFEINRIFARPFGTNLASQRVLEKAGFVLEARFEKILFKNGEYLDELVYAVRKQTASK